MAFEHEQRQARQILDGIEQGSMSAAQSAQAMDGADPALVYFIFSWLRSHYGPHHPAAEGVIGRLVEVAKQYPAVARLAKQGESDPLVAWFEDAYSYRDLDATAFIELIVEKLEG